MYNFKLWFLLNTYFFLFSYKNRSAFFWFAQDERPKVRAANPSFAVGDIAKELGRRWSEVSPTLKSKYEGKAEKDRERYVRDKQDFQQMLKDEKNGIGSIKSEKGDDSEDDEIEEEIVEEEHDSEWKKN